MRSPLDKAEPGRNTQPTERNHTHPGSNSNPLFLNGEVMFGPQALKEHTTLTCHDGEGIFALVIPEPSALIRKKKVFLRGFEPTSSPFNTPVLDHLTTTSTYVPHLTMLMSCFNTAKHRAPCWEVGTGASEWINARKSSCSDCHQTYKSLQSVTIA